MDFSSHLAALDGAVSDHLCDEATYSTGDGDPVPVRIMVEHPRDIDRLQSVGFARDRPVIHVRRSACPGLREGHFFRHGVDLWEVAEAPTADGDGRWWVVEVMPG